MELLQNEDKNAARTAAEKYLIFSTLTYFQYFNLLNNSVGKIFSLILSKITENSENAEFNTAST